MLRDYNKIFVTKKISHQVTEDMLIRHDHIVYFILFKGWTLLKTSLNCFYELQDVYLSITAMVISHIIKVIIEST